MVQFSNVRYHICSLDWPFKNQIILSPDFKSIWILNGQFSDLTVLLIYFHLKMDVPTLSTFLSPILNVASVWNTGETGDINVVT